MTIGVQDHLTRTDPVLGRLIERVGPCSLQPRNRRSPYQSLVRAVVYQQLNGTAAGTILGRVKALYPGRRFPSAEELAGTPDDRLRSAGLSRAKIAAVKDIAVRTLQGVVPSGRHILTMNDDDILARLTTLRGVGPWTVQMLLIFTLGRPDVLPATDYGVRKGFALTYRLKELPEPEELLDFGERWRPYRTTAAWYLWRAVELNNGSAKRSPFTSF